MPCVRATPRRRCSNKRWRASWRQPSAAKPKRAQCSRPKIRKAASSRRRKSPTRCCGCAPRVVPASPARPSRYREARHGERAAARHRGAERELQQVARAAMDQSAARQPADRKRGARAAESAVQRHLAALRRHGGALPQARRHADERDLAFFDGVERQRHRHRRPPGFRRPGRACAAQRRPPHVFHQPHPQGPHAVRRHGGGARKLGRRAARRAVGARRRADVGQAEIVPQRLGGRSMTKKMAALKPTHFLWRMDGAVAVIQLSRPERKNPLTFESYAELRDTFRDLAYADDVHAVVFLSNGGNFCSGGDVHEIIGPLVAMDAKQLLAFTRMTGALVKAMLHCGKPIIAAVDGVAAGAGAIIAMASDMRIATPTAQTAFLFNRVGLAGCDMGACAILPRIIGQGRAAELLYTGRAMTAQEGEAWGFFNRLVAADALDREALALAQKIAAGPTFANGITKTQLVAEWSMSLDQAIEAEAQAQAICMQTKDFERAYRAFVAKQKPVFEGN